MQGNIFISTALFYSMVHDDSRMVDDAIGPLCVNLSPWVLL